MSDDSPEVDELPQSDDRTDRDDSTTSDVKTAPDGTPIERTASPAQWEAVGRHALADLLRHRRDEIDREIEQVASAVEYGAPVDEDHVRNLRDAIEVLELAVEARLVPLVDGFEPWERTVGRVPFGRMLDALEIDGADVAHSQKNREVDSTTE